LCVFIHYHHPGMVPSFTGVLRNEFFREAVVKILQFHRSDSSEIDKDQPRDNSG
jgi:hypothetical protein